MKLTLGMAVRDDFVGVYFTVQALAMYHDLTDCEILVIDNKGDDRMQDWLRSWHGSVVRCETCTDVGTTQARNAVFEMARGDWTFCMDSHVFLWPGAVEKVKRWTQEHADCRDLLQGPMVYDNLKACTTHMEPVWRDNMWGIWAEVIDVGTLPSEAFEIPMHGLGLFGCRTDSWLGFNQQFRGFGGEEGYIHEKYRKAGLTTLCLPFMVWMHKFFNISSKSVGGVDVRDRIRNYFLGFRELGLDETPIVTHFGKRLCDAVRETL